MLTYLGSNRNVYRCHWCRSAILVYKEADRRQILCTLCGWQTCNRVWVRHIVYFREGIK